MATKNDAIYKYQYLIDKTLICSCTSDIEDVNMCEKCIQLKEIKAELKNGTTPKEIAKILNKLKED